MSWAGVQSRVHRHGAHESWRLNLDNENVDGIYPSIDFLKKSKMRGVEVGQGSCRSDRRGKLGCGCSARGTSSEECHGCIPPLSSYAGRDAAYEEEIEAALEEGVRIETLISPVKIKVRQEEIETAIKEGVELHTLVSPIKICTEEGRLVGIECMRNRLGEVDSTGSESPWRSLEAGSRWRWTHHRRDR
jgi:NADPH-dependent glutamate synthase beta subunit-like oxidoreductase